MVMMSNCPPLVAMSVVTRWRRTFSSSTTQLSLMPVAASNFGDSFCMMIMSELLTVAMFNVVSAKTGLTATAPKAASATLAPASKFVVFILDPPRGGAYRLMRWRPRQCETGRASTIAFNRTCVNPMPARCKTR